MGWIWFAFTVVTDVIATAALGYTRGRLLPGPITVAVIGYILSFIGLWQAMRRIDMAVVYALWSAVGTASIAVVGTMMFGEHMTPTRAMWLAVIVVGVAGLQLSGAHSASTHAFVGADRSTSPRALAALDLPALDLPALSLSRLDFPVQAAPVQAAALEASAVGRGMYALEPERVPLDRVSLDRAALDGMVLDGIPLSRADLEELEGL
jgi:small multidrug resistance pump